MVGRRSVQTTLAFAAAAKVVLSAIAFAQGSEEAIGFRIFGGEDTEENEFPSLAYVRVYKYDEANKRRRTEYCGGVIISEKWILTSGHCVKNGDMTFVGVGSSNRTKAKFLEGKRVISHKNISFHGRNNNNAANDIGLIELKEPVVVDGFSVEIAVLARESQSLPSNEGAIVVGWGRNTSERVKPGQESPKMLQKLQADIIPCPDANKNVTCIKSREGTGICDGDSGGPLVVKGRVYGIASYVDNINQDPHLDPNKHCTDGGTWAVYMSIPAYRTWIRETSGT